MSSLPGNSPPGPGPQGAGLGYDPPKPGTLGPGDPVAGRPGLGLSECAQARPPGRRGSTETPAMNPHDPLLQQTRRHFFRQCALGIGSLGLASLLSDGKLWADANPLAARRPHFQPRARNVIYLFMAGGPSQLELFDPKPRL